MAVLFWFTEIMWTGGFGNANWIKPLLRRFGHPFGYDMTPYRVTDPPKLMNSVPQNGNWSELDPYAQLIGALLPRAAGITAFDTLGEIRWTSDDTVSADLSRLVGLSLTASAQKLDASGERVSMSGDAPAYLFWIRDDAQQLICILAISWRSGEAEQRTFAFVHSLVKPALECLRRELLSRARFETLSTVPDVRDRDLDVLLQASSEPEKGGGSGDEIKHILQNATNHLGCEFAALVVPERNLVVISTAEGRKVDTSVIARIHRHLISLAQVRCEPIILNSPAALPGVQLPYRVLSSPVRNPAGRAGGVFALFRLLDAPAFRERDAQLADLLARRTASVIEASYDSLSGLLTRNAFEQRSRVALNTRAADRKTKWCGLYIDTDRMHVINDNFGMHVGDRLIAKMGELIRSRLMPGALAARISGDRFAILLPSDAGNAVTFAEALRQGVESLSPAHLGASADASFAASVSIGVAAIVDPRVEFAHAFAVAETACKAAKDRGRNRVELYQDSDLSIMQRYEDMNIAPSLRAAMNENRMRLDSQLILPLPGSQSTIPHFEILLRMIDDNGETVGPDRFLSAAVRYQLMPTVDRWVITEAIRLLQPHSALLADRPVVFTINVSGQSLGEPDFADFVIDLIKGSGLNPKILCFELTESAAIANMAKAEVIMRRLRALGCDIALDDFGTGLSSLAYLRSLPVDMLKIDGSFIRDILKDPRAESMVQAVAHLARSMNLVTVAEYVETDEIRLRVATLGVDYGQGFAIARPVPLTETIAELPMYATTPVYSLEGLDDDAAAEAILADGTDPAAITCTAQALPDPGELVPESESESDSDEDTNRRLEIIIEGHDHAESALYQRRSGG